MKADKCKDLFSYDDISNLKIAIQYKTEEERVALIDYFSIRGNRASADVSHPYRSSKNKGFVDIYNWLNDKRLILTMDKDFYENNGFNIISCDQIVDLYKPVITMEDFESVLID